MLFKREDLIDIENNDLLESSPFKIIEEGEWELDYKDYASKETIFEYEGKTYMLDSRRSGSYYTDYYYDSDDWPELVECPEVEKVPVIVDQWRVK